MVAGWDGCILAAKVLRQRCYNCRYVGGVAHARLKARPETHIPKLWPSLQLTCLKFKATLPSGLFFLQKSDGKRICMIIDARGTNCVLKPPPGVDVLASDGLPRIFELSPPFKAWESCAALYIMDSFLVQATELSYWYVALNPWATKSCRDSMGWTANNMFQLSNLVTPENCRKAKLVGFVRKQRNHIDIQSMVQEINLRTLIKRANPLLLKTIIAISILNWRGSQLLVLIPSCSKVIFGSILHLQQQVLNSLLAATVFI